MVLTLADGPDLNELVDMGGALSTSLVRLAARHLISAVAYLHGRGSHHNIMMCCVLYAIYNNGFLPVFLHIQFILHHM